MNQDQEASMKFQVKMMNFNSWTKQDVIQFLEYFKTFKNEDKVVWTKNIVNTKLDVYAVKASDLKTIVKGISKSNIKNYLDLELLNIHELTIIYASLLDYLNDFEDLEYYLMKLSLKAENWATTDSVILKRIYKKDREKLFDLAISYLDLALVFQKRIGIRILFLYLQDDDYIDIMFDKIKILKDIDEYYVNMGLAWLLCEAFIKKRSKTILFMNEGFVNDFVANKFVSKCRDSFRVSSNDKEMLLKYKR